MKLILYSITHHNCPIAQRERLALAPGQRKAVLRKMHTKPQISEAAVLETCNRIEFYLYAEKSFDSNGFLTDLIKKQKTDAVDTWKKYSRYYEGIDVIRHFFEVAAGLDSQMIGENQILSQLKSAYTESINCRMSKLIFHRLFHNAFRVGKAVRTKTAINCGAASVALAAIQLAKKKIILSRADAIVIGAGKNARLIAKYLLKSKPPSLIIANRNPEKAKSSFSDSSRAKIISLKNVTPYLTDADLLISSTASQKPVLTYKALKNALTGRKKPLLIIDIAVPRDIEPKISRLKSVDLYNIDDLKEQIKINKHKRSSEIPKAKEIVGEFTEKFAGWLSSLDVAPVISKLNQRTLDIARRHAARYARDFAKNNGENVDEKLRLFAESLAKKMLHSPISFLKQSGKNEPNDEQLKAADLINKIFLSEPDGCRR